MTTVMPMSIVSAEEPESEDGLTFQQRRILYKLLTLGEVSAEIADNHDYQLAKKLGFHPAISGEIGDSMRGLVELGRVKHFISASRDTSYGEKYEVSVTSVNTYRPVDASCVGNPVLSWITIYGPLVYEEFTTPSGGPDFDRTVAGAMGEDVSSTSEILGFIGQAIAAGRIQETTTACPSTKLGSKGKQYAVMKTTVTLEFVDAKIAA